MNTHLFQPQTPDVAGVISWVHFGDLHMTKACEQNHLDLAESVNEVNQAFAIDGNVVSWRFVELGRLPIAVITSPSDEQLLTKSSEIPQETLKVGAKFWGEVEAVEASASLDGHTLPMKRISDSHVWEAVVLHAHEGTPSLKVSFKDAHGKVANDEIRLAVGQRTERKSEERDQDNALEAWPEHGLFGARLGPNENGKKW